MVMMTTVQAGSGVTVTVQTSAQNAILAQQIAALISNDVTTGAVRPALSTDGAPPVLPSGQLGAYFQEGPGLTFLPTGYTDFVDSSNGPVSVLGSGADDQKILFGSGNLTAVEPGGSGTIVGGEGRHQFALLNVGQASDWLISAAGRDTIMATGPGNDTIDGVGSRTLVEGGMANITFIGGHGSATVFGGGGSDTISGGDGRLIAHGGTAGHNVLSGGTGAATLFGGGNGDELFAQGTHRQQLVAGVGNETLTGSADGGRDIFTFTSGNHGKDTVIDFTRGVDKIDLEGFGQREVSHALATQVDSNGSVTLTLSDHTKITFADVSHLSARDFLS